MIDTSSASNIALRRLNATFRYSAVHAFLIAFAAACLIAILQGEKAFLYDAGNYWHLSETFTRNGAFSLLNFENTGLRGYALPLTYYSVRHIGALFWSNEAQTVPIFNAALFAAVGAVLAPRLAQITWPGREWGLSRRLLLSGLILVFWRGYLSYPLSDFAALAAVLVSLIAISSPDSLRWMLFGGVAAALATNIRPSYVLLIPILTVLLLWDWVRHRSQQLSPRRRALGLCLFAAGAILISLPQSLSEHKSFGNYDPIPGGNQLMGLQYTEGLKLQRYETFTGGTGKTPRMLYIDPNTRGILAQLEGGVVSGTSQYLKIATEHPFTVWGVFLRHLVNGLDQRYTTPYVEHLESDWNLVFRFTGFLLVFLAMARMGYSATRRSLGLTRWRYPGAILLISMTALPSAVETRFLLPVFSLCAMIVLAPGWKLPLQLTNQGLRGLVAPAILLAAAVVYFCLVWMIVSGATDHLRFG